MSPTDLPPEPSVASMVDEPAERRKRIRRLVILILLISVGIHIVAGLGAGIWVIARYFAQPQAQFVVQKQVQMAPQDREHRMRMEEVTSLRQKPVFNNRIQSLRPSKLALPELPRIPLETITPIDTEALISDQVEGLGQHGTGSGSGPGGFFGGSGAAGSGLLAGRLFDLKKNHRGEGTPGGMTNEKYLSMVGQIARSPNATAALDKFFAAPDTLYMPRLAVPIISANEAPKAFKVEKEIQPSYWIAVYQGRATAPDTGSYKFVGFADDILLVKINGRLVFDGSLLGATRLAHKEGTTFSVKKGEAYDIEIIIGECPGGYFSGWLQLQKQGGSHKPYWFRMNNEPVKYNARGGDGTQQKPQDGINGPVWWPASKKEVAPGVGL